MMADYIKLGASRTGLNYILMLVDKFSRFVLFVPTVAATAVEAARAILLWASMFGLPKWLVSDGGSHFDNELLDELTELLDIEHHITLAYCPWANGSVEVVGKDLLWTLRATCSELRFAADEWDLVSTLVAYVINHRPRPVLGNHSAVEMMTGKKPDSAVTLAAYSGVKMKDMVTGHVQVQQVEAFCEDLFDSLEVLHADARNRADAQRRQHALRQAKKGPGMRFNVGDLVLVPSYGNAANKSAYRPFKPMVGWQGPYEVTRAIAGSPAEFMVRLVGETREHPVHWRKMRRLAGPDLPVTKAVELSAKHDIQRFLVKGFVEWSVNTDQEVDVLVEWQGHDDEGERTWEALEQLVEDVPVLIAKYVQADGHQQLVAAHRRAVRDAKTKKKTRAK